MNTFILVDSALLDGGADMLALTDGLNSGWMAPLYDPEAYAVTPLLVDVDAAVSLGKVDLVMAMVNARRPQLHVSVIDTDLTLPELAHHFRQFIHIETEAGEELTLRFADSAVLPALALHLSAGQWCALAAPFATWHVHERDGSLKALPLADPKHDLSPIPFILTSEQIEALKDAMGTDRLLVNLGDMRLGESLGRNPMEAFRWASEARRIWLASGRADDALLLKFAQGVFDTKGRILRLSHLTALVAQPDLEKVWDDLRELVDLNNYDTQAL